MQQESEEQTAIIMKEIYFVKADSIKVQAEVASYIDSLKDDKQYKIEIKELKQKRSLSANAYAWVLLDKLSAKLNKSKEDIYREYIKDVGDNSYLTLVQSNAVDELQKSWAEHGLGWVSDKIPSGNEGWTYVMLYYGSSTYDKEQMSRLINLIVQDCEELDIPTYDQAELEELYERWGE